MLYNFGFLRAHTIALKGLSQQICTLEGGRGAPGLPSLFALASNAVQAAFRVRCTHTCSMSSDVRTCLDPDLMDSQSTGEPCRLAVQRQKDQVVLT
jgi:hypothetical protein